MIDFKLFAAKNRRNKMNICYIDTETGGLDPKVNPILQIAGILVIDGKEIDRFNFKVKPFDDQKIEQKAIDCNGLTLEQIEGFEDPKTVADKIDSILLDANYHGKWFFCGYNAGFDESMMREFFIRCGKKYFDYFITPHLDVMTLAGFVLGDEIKSMPNFKLGTVAEYIGVKLEEEKLHDAMYDIEITRALMRECFSRFKKKFA
jgi:DNA polymerase-3 subunit epsilon